MTTLSSKLVGGEKEFFGQMCVDAVMHLDQDLLDPRMIGVK
jgi:T-complex protein 1 subunit eta